MADAGDRMERAGRYVLGLMNADERDRAERDLEIDPAFREAMLTVAERMNAFGNAGATVAQAHDAAHDPWRQIKDRIDQMPQMRPAETQASLLPDPPARVPVDSWRDVAEKPATFGRRKTDFHRVPLAMPEPVRMGPGTLCAPVAAKLAIALIIAFAFGYLMGRM